MKLLDRAMRSFCALLKLKHQGGEPNTVRLPHYLSKSGYFVCIFPKDSFKVEKGQIRISLGKNIRELGTRFLYFRYPPHIHNKLLKEVRIIPRYQGRYFEIEYVYQVEPESPSLESVKKMAIDLGLDNFATCVSPTGPAFILEGKGLKSYNRWWNKQKGRLQSVYDKQRIRGEAPAETTTHHAEFHDSDGESCNQGVSATAYWPHPDWRIDRDQTGGDIGPQNESALSVHSLYVVQTKTEGEV